MYNINSHYQTIFESLKKYVKHRRLLYLMPYGSTKYENIETLTDEIGHLGGVIDEGPMFIFYDQEPVYDYYNYTLFDYIKQNFQPPFVLVTTERDSIPVDNIVDRYDWPTINYFHHIFAASDWFRGYRLHDGIIPVTHRQIKKKFITFNRITGNSRIYRSIFVAELHARGLLDFGHVSFSKHCPIHGDYDKNLDEAVDKKLINPEYSKKIKLTLDSIYANLRIDQVTSPIIKNDSMTLGPLESLMESFVYVVTETCFWETKKHLTEKIFKPIVAKQPFILLGCAENLKYLKEYGFKTFDAWWDESYDTINDPIERLHAVVDLIEKISKYDLDTLQKILQDMESTLEYNHNLFFSKEFVDGAWQELQDKIKQVAQQKFYSVAEK